VRQLPTGIVTLLFTDMEGSTRLLQRLGERYAGVLKECRHLLRMAFQQANGQEVDTQGDAFFIAFERAADAVSSAVNAQRALFNTSWPDNEEVRVRIGIHTGEPQPAEEGYIGLDVHQAARIMSSAHGGQVLLSRITRNNVIHDLPNGVSLRDLGEYHLKDIAGLNRLYQLVIPDLPSDFPPLSTLSPRHPFQSLPSPTTSFIGREREVETACEHLRQRDVRLLTLIGTAGVGKTRLALKVAEDLSDSFAGGVCFVALERVSDAEGAILSIAQALRIVAPRFIEGEKDATLFETVVAAIQERSLLLVLDNFEHVMPARQLVVGLLEACPKLKVLVTSRIMLHLRAEHLQEVSPLALPELGFLEEAIHTPLRSPSINRGARGSYDLIALSQYASIELFVQRAQAVQPGFQLIESNIADIAEICIYLDGIPLALELAAARLRHFSPQALLSHLRQGLTFLKGDTYDVPARQRTLQAAIGWSYDLLATTEKSVFRRLAVSVHGVTLPAAERICTVAGPLEGSILDALDALVDQSMLQRQEREGDETHFSLLQTLREYGLDRMTQLGELEATRVAHAEYYFSWVEQVAPLLSGADQARWLDRMDREYENVRVALECLLDRAQKDAIRAEQALQFCIVLMGFWEIRGYVNEGLASLERALSMSHGVAPGLRAQALHGAGFLALIQDDNARAEAFLHESQLLFRESGDNVGMANILLLQGSLAMVKTSYKLARRLFEEALTVYRELGDTRRIAATRKSLAEVAIAQGDYLRARLLMEEDLASDRASGEKYTTALPLFFLARIHFLSCDDLFKAQALVEESLDLFKEVGNRRMVAYTRSLLGQILFMMDEISMARSTLEASIGSFRVLKERSAIAEVLIALGRLATLERDYEAAQASYKESWDLLRTISAKELSISCLEGYGEVLVAQGAARNAVQLWATAATVRAEIMAPMPPIYRTSYIQAVAAARKLLGDEVFRSAWAEGHKTSLEQVLL
jgi:predicted ATPase/class 3 adenylate cyclase